MKRSWEFCDHYWLWRRGGTCPKCGEVFPTQEQQRAEEDRLARKARWEAREREELAQALASDAKP
jgi:hypothetical protein